MIDPPAEPQRRLRIAGIHHLTLLCSDLRASTAFYRNVLGMSMVKETVNEDDQSARHLFFGDEQGRPGTLITCLEYPQMDHATVGVGSTHHFALSIETEEELHAWREYLTAQGVACTEVMDRTFCKSLYVRDPDGHIIELATLGPGITP